MSKKSLRHRKWMTKAISEIADVNPTTALPCESDGSIPLYEMAAIDEVNGELREPQMVPISSGRSGRTKFRNSDVLFAKITPCVQNGKSALVKDVPGDLAFGSSEFYVLRPGPNILPRFLFYFVRQRRVVEAAVASFTGTSGRQRVPRGFWDTLEIPVPPLPVQERIVEILAKADDIRRKRQQALDLASAVLPATFQDMFGDPSVSADLQALGSGIESIRNGISRRRKAIANTGQIVLRIQDVGDGIIDFEDLNRIELTESESASLTLSQGDMLMVRVNGNPDLVGRNAIFERFDEPVAHNDHLMRVRFRRDVLLPEYVAGFLRTPFGKHELASKVVTSAGNHSINQDGISNIRLPIAPLSRQLKFIHAVRQHHDTLTRLQGAHRTASRMFASLLSLAFTGELTAEWEWANAELIVSSQELQENLPRLALLAMLAEATRRRDSAVLVTALMKYLFLLQMEGNGRRRLYQFVPYHYGPFAKDLYADLEQLQSEGLIAIDNDTDEDKTRITMADPQCIEATLGEIPDDLHEDIGSILDEYGELDHNRLLKTVYKKYPAYAKNSRLRKKAAKKSAKRSQRPK